jgi:uncharacterized membrane protein YhiD involved in acid resistance
MACGARLYYLAVITTVLALVVLVGLGRVDKYLNRNNEQNKGH